jgi:hypothetical protein
MNKYGSKYTVLTVRGISQSIISPPNDYSWPFDKTNKVEAWITVPNINPNSNLLLRAVTVNSNFADGLVWKNPGSRMTVTVGCNQLIIGDIPTGTVSAPTGSYIITGIATTFITSLIVGQSIVVVGMLYKVKQIKDDLTIVIDRPVIVPFINSSYIRKTPPQLTVASYSGASKTVTVNSVTGINPSYFYKSGGTDNEFLFVNTIGVNSFAALNYPRGNGSFSPLLPVYKAPTFSQTGVFDVTRLNIPVEVNTYLSPVHLGTQGADATALHIYLGANYDTPGFLTKSINTAFDGNNCIFDVDLDLEYTL